MKLIFLILTIFCFNINISFASPESFREKVVKLEGLLEADSLTPEQSYLLVDMATKGFQDCSPSSGGGGYVCVFAEQLCTIKQNSKSTSINCHSESDIDKLLSVK